MISKQQEGFIIETTVFDLISKTKCSVLREKEIVRLYSKLSNGIDILIYTPTLIYCIQVKWRDSKSQLSDINHFLKCCQQVSEAEHKNCIGIYVSKLPITKGANDAFEYENKKNNNYYIAIDDENINLLLIKLSIFLYKNQIFFYENDGSAIMLDDKTI
jgi:hypothetical protein